MPKTIEVTVSPRGEVTIETRGFRGEECRAATREIEEALGRFVTETLTDEYHRWVGASPEREKTQERQRSTE